MVRRPKKTVGTRGFVTDKTNDLRTAERFGFESFSQFFYSWVPPYEQNSLGSKSGPQNRSYKQTPKNEKHQQECAAHKYNRLFKHQVGIYEGKRRLRKQYDADQLTELKCEHKP